MSCQTYFVQQVLKHVICQALNIFTDKNSKIMSSDGIALKLWLILLIDITENQYLSKTTVVTVFYSILLKLSPILKSFGLRTKGLKVLKTASSMKLSKWGFLHFTCIYDPLAFSQIKGGGSY